jgi:hypothetical protein
MSRLGLSPRKYRGVFPSPPENALSEPAEVLELAIPLQVASLFHFQGPIHATN